MIRQTTSFIENSTEAGILLGGNGILYAMMVALSRAAPPASGSPFPSRLHPSPSIPKRFWWALRVCSVGSLSWSLSDVGLIRCIWYRGAFPALPLWSLSPAWPGRFCAPSLYIEGLSPDYSASLRSTLLEVTLPGHSPVPRSTDGAGDARLRGGGQMVCSPSCGGQNRS